ncbi:MAG: hypothetical protein ABTQ34_02035 [Bdellovibrionales bacterium]
MNEKYAELGISRRIWAIAAIHGEVERLSKLHDYIAPRFAVRDRLVYLGNYFGAESRGNADLFDELLAFRAALLAKMGLEPSDIVYLRGPAEEAWQRLLRLQFAPVPLHALERALASGVEAWLRLYGVSVNDTKSMARAGSMAITRWTNHLRAMQRNAPGHEALVCSMRRAAFTRISGDQKRVLFVPAGFDATRSLDDQGEALWWTSAPFRVTGRNASGFNRIVRGFDSVNGGLFVDDVSVTLDGGCGRGGDLICGCFSSSGKLLELVTVKARGTLEAVTVEREIANDVHGADRALARVVEIAQEHEIEVEARQQALA